MKAITQDVSAPSRNPIEIIVERNLRFYIGKLIMFGTLIKYKGKEYNLPPYIPDAWLLFFEKAHELYVRLPLNNPLMIDFKPKEVEEKFRIVENYMAGEALRDVEYFMEGK